MNPTIDILRGELERHFSLEELQRASEDLLGLAAQASDADATKASFARTLAERCVQTDRVEALLDVMAFGKKSVDPRLFDALGKASKLGFEAGAKFAEFTIERVTGETEFYVQLAATCEARPFVLKILKRAAAADPRRVQRFLTATRLVARLQVAGLQVPGLATDVRAGEYETMAYVAHARVEGESLATKMARSGPVHFAEASKLLRSILEPLARVHAEGLAHGDLRPENLLIDKQNALVITDFGFDRLVARAEDTQRSGAPAAAANALAAMQVWGGARTLAPEVMRGRAADSAADVYAVGAIAYELLSGKQVFAGASSADVAAAHLAKAPDSLIARAPTGWITKEVDSWVLQLLDKEPSRRPRDAAAALEALSAIGKAPAAQMDAAAFDALNAQLTEAPQDHDAAVALERAAGQGASGKLESAKQAAATFEAAAAALETKAKAADIAGDDAAHVATRAELAVQQKGLLFRAGRIYSSTAGLGADAGRVYAAITELDPSDEVAFQALADNLRSHKKLEDLVELLLGRTQSAQSVGARAEAFAEIGALYVHELDDAEQATVAYAQALALAPANENFAHELERLCGTKSERWTDSLSTLTDAVKADDCAPADRQALLLLCARWYEQRLARPDLALFAFQQVLAAEPSNETASEGLAGIYRRAQQWPELLSVLTAKADAAPGTPRARDFRVEAAELLELRLNDPTRARDVYAQVLGDDPGHVKAGDALARIHEKAGDFAALVAVLEKRAETRRGAERVEALVRVAETYEDHLSDLVQATQRYDAALALDPKSMAALKGLDRIYNRAGKYRELLDNLERQIQAAATPRQKVGLYERIAALHDEEFLDHAAASSALEALLAIDPANDAALTAIVRNYRALHRWDAVVGVLERHADSTTDDPRRAELHAARARVLSEHIGSPERAIAAYEAVLKLQPGHAGALEAIAQLRENSGDANAALVAIESLANKAATPEARAEQWLRAGRLLEARGDKDGAIERYKSALEAHPRDAAASLALRKAYGERGDVGSVVALIEQELPVAETNLQRARLYAELARIQKDKLKDPVLAEQAAKKAGELDNSNADAALVLGDLAFESQRYADAMKFFESLVSRVQVLSREDGTRALTRYIEAFGKATPRAAALSGPDLSSMPPPAQTQPKLVAAVEALGVHAAGDVSALAGAAAVLFEHGDPKLVYRVYDDLFKKHDARLVGSDRAEALYQLGESARRSGELELAIGPLRESIKADASDPRPLKSLGKVYDATGDHSEALKFRRQRLPLVSVEERFELLLEIGDIEFQKLGDRGLAQKTYTKALEERPADRKLLTKLMQLYSEEKDWAKVVEVVTRLADFVDEKSLRAKYMHTAATIMGKQLNDVDKALEFYGKVLDLDPTLSKARAEAIELYRGKNAHSDVERLLTQDLEQAKEAGDRAGIVAALAALGELYHRHMNEPEMAIDALEAAQAFDPDDRARAETLAELYASDPAQYLDKAVRAQAQMLRHNPYRVESYKLLRKLYTEARQADAAWCLSQALSVLNLAGPDEEKFYTSHRAANAAPAQAVVVEGDWDRLAHPDLDPTLTRIFAALQGVIARSRTQTLEAQGYAADAAIDPSVHPYPMSQTLYYSLGVLGLHGVRTFQNAEDPCGLGFIHAPEPAILLGRAALEAQVATQMLAFVAARHLAFFRPGLYVRQLVPTTAGLKAWLFGAIKSSVPTFPVAPDIQGAVAECQQIIAQGIHGPARDVLASLVGKLLQSAGSIDLRRWVAAVDLTADRTGLLLAHDLEIATELIRAGEAEGAVGVKDRMKEVVLFSVSEDYFALRKTLSIAIDS